MVGVTAIYGGSHNALEMLFSNSLLLPDKRTHHQQMQANSGKNIRLMLYYHIVSGSEWFEERDMLHQIKFNLVW